MKRRILDMDPNELLELRNEGAGSLVERNIEPNGLQLVNPFAVARHEPSDLVELAREIQKADALVRSSTCSKLQMIAEQVRFLQEQARRVLMEAKQNTDLHHAACNFLKLPGHIYYLYEKQSGQKYFSMLSPQDWMSGNSEPPHAYIGSYRLEQDLSWTPENLISNRTEQMAYMDKLFGKVSGSLDI